MKILLVVIMGLILTNGETTLFDFDSPENSGNWQIVNDGVMGGLSESQIHHNPGGFMTFKGKVSLANNGGFASARTSIEFSDLKYNFKGVVVRAKGDGKVYGIRFRTHEEGDGYAYQFKIKTSDEEWEEFKIPFEDFEATFRGNTLKNKPALKSNDITQMGVLISDKQVGEFVLVLDWIKFYR
ncbi:CIA30 family protein [Marinilabilia salmonicolor]|uniref:CIA30 family protein n=1 Tax=Marinilabilia salmonicolor TaxID=989 RepID=UPI00029A5B27|nr:CIA30 family protein [Marinilabilia salmonicolor]